MIWSEKRRARKKHWCYLCGRDIDAGTKYVYGITPPPDGWHDYKAHIRCDEAWGKIGESFDWTFPGCKGDGREFIRVMEEAGI